MNNEGDPFRAALFCLADYSRVGAAGFPVA